MAQNIYDDPDFFEGYSQLPRSVGGLDDAPEWPSLQTMLPPLSGARVLDLGCGFGWFCRWAAAQGAASVLGVDLSENMLARAAADTPSGLPITYRAADLDDLELASMGVERGAIDLVYSSLTLHYLTDLARLFDSVHLALTPGGRFVCSVEHPIFTAPSAPGFVKAVDGRVVWPLDGYFDQGPRTTDWLADGVVKQHRTIAEYVTLLLAAGFTVTSIDEWGPSAAQIENHPDWARERERPPFLLLAAST